MLASILLGFRGTARDLLILLRIGARSGVTEAFGTILRYRRLFFLPSGLFKMENYPIRVNSIGQFYPDYMSDRKSRFLQIDNQPISMFEVICPQPCRPIRVSCLTNSLGRASLKPKGVKPVCRMDCVSEILDLLNQDDLDNDGFFCGSPPVRADNPIINDAQFVIQAESSASSISNSPDMKPARLERGTPTWGSSVGGSPKVRIEGFACGSPGECCVAPALA